MNNELSEIIEHEELVILNKQLIDEIRLSKESNIHTNELKELVLKVIHKIVIDDNYKSIPEEHRDDIMLYSYDRCIIGIMRFPLDRVDKPFSAYIYLTIIIKSSICGWLMPFARNKGKVKRIRYDI